MVDVQTRPEAQPPAPDRTMRTAAIWATVIAVPVALVVGLLIFNQVTPASRGAAPDPTVTQPAILPAAPVQMTAPELAARPAQVCLAVTSQLPAQVRDLAARKVSGGPEQNAAWGEPPLTLACGVAQPPMCETVAGGSGCVPLDTELLIMNGVCWYAAPGPAAAVFTTMDREIAVQVNVPTGYENPAQWANEFSDFVVETVKSKTAGVPSGCG